MAQHGPYRLPTRLRPAQLGTNGPDGRPAEYVTVAQAAAFLGVSHQRVRFLAAAGRFGWAVKRGKKEWLLPRLDVVRFKAMRRGPGRPPGGDWPFRSRILRRLAPPKRLRIVLLPN